VTASLPAFAIHEIMVCFAQSGKAAHASTWSVKRPRHVSKVTIALSSERILGMFVAVFWETKAIRS
jgi:hypothetical protein